MAYGPELLFCHCEERSDAAISRGRYKDESFTRKTVFIGFRVDRIGHIYVILIHVGIYR
jgi:hypothetical protein